MGAGGDQLAPQLAVTGHRDDTAGGPRRRPRPAAEPGAVLCDVTGAVRSLDARERYQVLYGDDPATVFQKPKPSICSYLMVNDFLLLNRMVIRSYQLLFALRRTWFAVIFTASERNLQHGPVR